MIRGRIGWPILFGTWLLAGCAPAYVSEPAAQLEPADIAMSTRGYAEMLDKFSEYSDAAVQKISNAVRDRMYLVGDESRTTLTTARINMFDAITYYTSTQGPYGNLQSFDQIKEMGDKVRAAGKRWYAPLNPGYNSILLNTGPRARSRPDRVIPPCQAKGCHGQSRYPVR